MPAQLVLLFLSLTSICFAPSNVHLDLSLPTKILWIFNFTRMPIKIHNIFQTNEKQFQLDETLLQKQINVNVNKKKKTHERKYGKKRNQQKYNAHKWKSLEKQRRRNSQRKMKNDKKLRPIIMAIHKQKEKCLSVYQSKWIVYFKH